MPQPTLGQLFVDPALTNISVAFAQDREGFIAHRVFPIVDVDKPEGSYYVWDRGDLLRSDAKRRTPGTESAGKTLPITTQTYVTEEWSLHMDIPDEHRRAQDEAVDLEESFVNAITEDLLIQRDVQWANAFFTTGVWDTDFTPGTLWDAASPTIVDDVLTQGNLIKAACGRRPNKFVCVPDVWRVIKNDADIVDRVKYVGSGGRVAGEPTTDQVAELFDVEEVLIMDSIRNTASKGAAYSGAFIGGTQDALLVYANPTPSKFTPSGGYIMVWPEFDDLRDASMAGGAGMRKFRMENVRSDRIESSQYYDMNVVASACGIFFDNVKAA